jgi:hypothetical protein
MRLAIHSRGKLVYTVILTPEGLVYEAAEGQIVNEHDREFIEAYRRAGQSDEALLRIIARARRNLAYSATLIED